MVSYHTIRLLPVMFCIIPSFADSFLKLSCESSVTGTFNEDTKIQCTATSEKEWKLIEIGLFKMEKKRNVAVFNFKESVNEVQGRIKLLHPGSQNMSLMIQNTQVSDSGKYQYYLQTTIGHRISQFELKVKAPYHMTMVPKMFSSTRRGSIICEATGYPQAEMHWFFNGTMNLTSQANTNSEETPQGLYKITSTLQLKAETEVSECVYTCAMWNVEDSLYADQEKVSICRENLPFAEIIGEERKNVVVFVIMALLFVAFVIVAVLQFKRRSYPKIRRESQKPMITIDEMTDV
ncbi:programmed cell death 1 ligand 2-like [Chiloscyllium plagiosum]|uniref:programmed cell death 1 ligand 2-like n=1 Tax=Chiloscyllium plagiosum TaxID=36176 RepID=UPI001CB80AE0|nr:programmed cell death 1 ligand 2-like [Chiloscyllium plagiosum]